MERLGNLQGGHIPVLVFREEISRRRAPLQIVPSLLQRLEGKVERGNGFHFPPGDVEKCTPVEIEANPAGDSRKKGSPGRSPWICQTIAPAAKAANGPPNSQSFFPKATTSPATRTSAEKAMNFNAVLPLP